MKHAWREADLRERSRERAEQSRERGGAPRRRQELTAQVGISEISNCKTWNENEQVCGMTECHKRFRFRTRFLQLEISEIPT